VQYSRLPAAPAQRRATQPTRPGTMAGVAGKPADRACSGQSRVAELLWRRSGQDERGLWRAGRLPVAAGFARLAGRRVSRIGLGRERIESTYRYEPDVQAKLKDLAGLLGERSREQVPRPISASPFASHGASRHRTRDERTDRFAGW